ncbi:MAG: hypothetical protein KAY24_03845 [Candidatus Eisenbacteria sp.]|nr:hypothetical protein [Candidatus Eisenbacteria bacterium]
MRYLACAAWLLLFGCAREPVQVTELKHYPVDSMDEVITRSGIELDTEIASEGSASLRITATEPTTVRLFETGDIDIEDARLIYEAKLRTEDVEGKVYLEMWCHLPGKGEAFSRALHSPLSGNNEWTSQETPFFLKKGENPDNVRLNVVVEGKGTVWIDEIRLVKGPLR